MASNDTPKVVVLKGNPMKKEAAMTASQAILPGHLVSLVSTGTLSKHATAAGKTQTAFADVADFSGGGLETAYSDGETVPYIVANAGDEIYAILEDGHTIAVGDLLESAGDGTLQAQTGNFSVAIALEAVTTSGSTSRIKVEVL